MAGVGVLAVLALAAVLTVLLLAVRDVRVKQGEALRLKDAVVATAFLERLVVDLQTGSRGFVIAGQRRFLMC